MSKNKSRDFLNECTKQIRSLGIRVETLEEAVKLKYVSPSNHYVHARDFSFGEFVYPVGFAERIIIPREINLLLRMCQEVGYRKCLAVILGYGAKKNTIKVDLYRKVDDKFVDKRREFAMDCSGYANDVAEPYVGRIEIRRSLARAVQNWRANLEK